MLKNILVVDDSLSIRQMIEFTLKGAGYTVVNAEDGVDALNKAQTQQFDCIITDLNMPKKDGITFVKELKLLAEYKFTPVLMLTTESGLEKKSMGKEAGVSGWIVKPFQPKKLLKTIDIVMS